MENPSKNHRKKKNGCLPNAAGFLVSALLFPFCIYLFGWLAFAFGPMGCAFPSKCSPSQQNIKAILSLVLLVGGGFGIPITTGILVAKLGQRQSPNRSMLTEDNQSAKQDE